MALRIHPNLMTKDPRTSSDSLIISVGVSRDADVLLTADGDKIGTYLEAVNHPLMLYATNANFANATFETSSPRTMSNVPAVQFADAVLFKAVRWEIRITMSGARKF